ncbi:MAG: methionyl-tRNA formyltransferase, partial [Chloroflexota bacterium]|nr:methionyl-tRNA formyltransferase [Chloroflexota bacterium]
LARRVRAYNPWPVAYTWWGDERLRLLRARPVGHWHAPVGGVWLDPSTGYPTVSAGRGSLALLQVQTAGSKALDGRDFVRGRRELVGAVLGQPAMAPNSES